MAPKSAVPRFHRQILDFPKNGTSVNMSITNEETYCPGLVEEETRVPDENLQCLVESNWRHSSHMGLR